MTSKQQLSLREKHPELFIRDTNIDRRGAKRTVPMEVLNLSMPRTGTASMQIALQILEIPTFHSLDFFHNMRDTTLWNSALDKKYFTTPPQPLTRTEWDSILGHYSGVSDVPALAFASDLITAYPEAKVILIERDIEAWYKSFDEAVIANVWSKVIWAVARVDPFFVRPLEQVHQKWARGWMRANSREEMRANARAVFREHHEMVKRVTPKERLLVYKLGDGWGPLCEFLGKEVLGWSFRGLMIWML